MNLKTKNDGQVLGWNETRVASFTKGIRVIAGFFFFHCVK